jgi:hypothetical protein
MYVDTQLEFSDAQAVTSTAISTNVVDLHAAVGAGTALTADTLIDQGVGTNLWLVVQTQTACTDSGSDATLTISLESDSTANLATSATVHYTTTALAFASFATAGTRLVVLQLPRGNYERYLGVRYTVASGPLTAGAFDAFLTTNPGAGNIRAYKTAFTVS